MSPKVDCRTIHHEPDDEALEALQRLQPVWLDLQIELALQFWRVKRKRAGAPKGLTQIQHVGTALGYCGFQAQDLARLGESLDARPEIVDLLREGRLSLRAAILLSKPLGDERFRRAEDPDWVELASRLRLRDLKRRIQERQAQIDGGEEATRRVDEIVSRSAHEDLLRCQELVSQKDGHFRTLGFTLGVVAEDYRNRHDPRRREPRERRMPDTRTRPGQRGIPAEVMRGLDRRSDGICEVGACQHLAQQACHIEPVAEGSASELQDLFAGCRECHKAYDIGWIRFLGWTSDGRPRFYVRESGAVLEPKPRPERGHPGPGGPGGG